MRSASSHKNVEGGRKVIIDINREIKGMGDPALRNERKDRCSASGSVWGDSVLGVAVV